MTTIVVSGSATRTVSTHIPAGTSYLVEGSGTLDVVNGGVVSGAITVSGFPATVSVTSGGIVSGLLTISDTRVNVYSGGTTEQTAIVDFGSLFLSGGVAISTTVDSFSELEVFSGGLASATTVSGTLDVEGGGTANLTTATAGGDLSIFGFQNVFGLASVIVVNSGGSQNIGSGGTASNTTINDGGAQSVNGGTANTATINSGGVQTVAAGGVAIGATISGGAQSLSQGANAVTTTIDSGGTQTVGNSATASGTTVSSGGTQVVNFGGKAISTTIASGGLEQVSNSGTTSGVVISGGMLELGGTSFGSGAITFAAPGGIAHFTPGSTALSNVISGLDAGDSLYFDATPVNFSPVFFGVNDTAILSGSTQLHAVLNGTAYNFNLADLSPGVSVDVVPISVGILGNPTFPFATAINVVSATSVTTTLSDATVTLGQAERVLGTTLNISVGTGGEQTIKNGGRASNTTIDNGGWQLVSAGGAATGAIDNGIQFIFAGPTAAAEGRSGP